MRILSAEKFQEIIDGVLRGETGQRYLAEAVLDLLAEQERLTAELATAEELIGQLNNSVAQHIRGRALDRQAVDELDAMLRDLKGSRHG